jgi:hypothetical protein
MNANSKEQKSPMTTMKGKIDSTSTESSRKRGLVSFTRKGPKMLLDSSGTSQQTSSAVDTCFEACSTSSTVSETSFPSGADPLNSSVVGRGILKVKSQDVSISRKGLSPRAESEIANEFRSDHSLESKPVVKFGLISIRNHLICLSDNPSVSIGPPLGISWQAISSCTIGVDEYEKTKPSPRDRQEMLVPLKVRETMLMAAGHSRLELGTAARQANTVRANRRKSANDGQFKEGISSLMRKLKMSSRP